MPRKPKARAVLQPNLGIYYDRAPLALSDRMLQDGLNFRVKQGVLTNLNMGWQRLDAFTLNGPVVLIANFLIRGLAEKLVFGTFTDLYKYDPNGTVAYITPRYETGTISTSGTAVVGVGTTFTDSGVKSGDEIYVGATGQTNPAAAWKVIDEVTDNTHLILTTSVATVSGSAYTIRKKFTGTIFDVWHWDVFVNASPANEDQLWMTNGVDNIVRWNGTDTQVEVMSALGFKAKSLVVFSNMMIFLNLIQSGTSKPTDMINSNPGEPQNVTTGLSEQFKVHSGVDEILTAAPLGDNLAIYSRRHVTLAQFLGDPFIFAFRQVTSGTGIVAGKALANFGNYHQFLGADTQYYFDGATVKTINNHIWREILRQQDPGRIQLSFTHFDEENGDLIWSVPSTVDPNPAGGASKASGEHYLEQPGVGMPTPFSRRDFPFTTTGYYKRQDGLQWDSISDVWQNLNFRWNDRFFFAAFPLNMAGDMDGKVYTFNTSQDANGVGLPSFVQFGRRAIMDGRIRGLLTRIYPFVKQFNTPVDVTAFMYDSAFGNVHITEVASFDQLQALEEHFAIIYRRGRYFEVKFSSDGPGQPWEIAGYDVDVRHGGKR